MWTSTESRDMELTPGRLQGGYPDLTRKKSEEQIKSKKGKKLTEEYTSVYARRTLWDSNT